MNIYIVAATEQEIELTRNWCKLNFQQDAINVFKFRKYKIHFYVHGIGILATAFHLSKIAGQQPDFIIQAGIAGSFTDKIKLGEVVRISKECLGDFGADDNDNFLSIFDMGLISDNDTPFHKKWIHNTTPLPPFFETIKSAKGATVQKVSGNKNAITQIKECYNPDIESMEGAALHYVGNLEHIKYIQLRSISNKVEIRDKSKWKIKDAISSLNNCIIDYLKTL